MPSKSMEVTVREVWRNVRPLPFNGRSFSHHTLIKLPNVLCVSPKSPWERMSVHWNCAIQGWKFGRPIPVKSALHPSNLARRAFNRQTAPPELTVDSLHTCTDGGCAHIRICAIWLEILKKISQPVIQNVQKNTSERGGENGECGRTWFHSGRVNPTLQVR